MMRHGDLFDVLPTLPEASVDACVTDPPYGIGFMGREWDTFKPETQAAADRPNPLRYSDNPNLKGRKRAPAVSNSQIPYDYTVEGLRQFQAWTEQWAREVHRVLKPGAYLVVCGAPRSYHRMACGLEDAGFVIRDKFSYLFGQGFPKSHNFGCKCRGNAIHYSQNGASGNDSVRGVREGSNDAAGVAAPDEASDLLTSLQRDSPQQSTGEAFAQGPGCVDAGECSEPQGEDVGREQSGVEGRELHRAGEGLSNDPAAGSPSSTNERVRAGAHRSGGEDSRPSPEAERGSASQGSGPSEQRPGQSASLRLPSRTLDRGASDRSSRCERCGGLTSARGLGTALKPGHEPIALAWKPFKGTIADNYIKHGTAALNVDACRIEGVKPQVTQGINSNPSSFAVAKSRQLSGDPNEGRWPSNVLLDEFSAAALDEQTGELRPGHNARLNSVGTGSRGIYGRFTPVTTYGPSDTGGASRFFYIAKPSREERDHGGERNIHPTVKPVELMRWLVKLVTPINGTVLDPFTGSGTTGMACRYELRNFIGIEREAEYVAIAERRIAQCVPLFGEATA